jgi:hypothetical protein
MRDARAVGAATDDAADGRRSDAERDVDDRIECVLAELCAQKKDDTTTH